MRYRCLLTEFLTDSYTTSSRKELPYGVKFAIVISTSDYDRLVEDDLISVDKGVISKVCIYKENIPLYIQNTNETIEMFVGRGISITTDITLEEAPKLIIEPIIGDVLFRSNIDLLPSPNMIKIFTIVCILQPLYFTDELVSFSISWNVLNDDELLVESKTSADVFVPEDIYVAKRLTPVTYRLYDLFFNKDLHKEVSARNFKDVFENKKYYL